MEPTVSQIDYALRPAKESDRDWLWETKTRCMRDYVEQTWGTWDEPAQRERFDANFAQGEINVITSGVYDVGFIAARHAAGEIRIFNLMIAPEFQHQGLGTAVLIHVQDVAKALGVPLRLQVLKVNPARALYERLGFTVTEETETHYQMEWWPLPDVGETGLIG